MNPSNQNKTHASHVRKRVVSSDSNPNKRSVTDRRPSLQDAPRKKASSSTTKKKQHPVSKENTFKNPKGYASNKPQPGRTSQKKISSFVSSTQQRKTDKTKSQSKQPSAMNARRGPNMAPPKKKRRGMNGFLKGLIIALCLIIVFGGAFTVWQVKSDLNTQLKNPTIRSEFCISDQAAQTAMDHRVINVLVFGIDGREEETEDVAGDRSDTMMICSADLENGGIKITSLMRDTFTWIEDEGYYDKLNSAYFFGGPAGSLRTVNKNFDTAITDYVTINFESMVYMVDAVGGVEVNIEDEDELEWVNMYALDVAYKLGTSTDTVPGTGTQLLNGTQALGYCRVRYTGRGDYDRTRRQRDVMEQVIGKVLTLNPIKQYRLLMQVLPYIETSLSFNQILKYGINVITMKSKSISQMRLPTDDYVGDAMIDDISYVCPDTLADNISALYRFIYKIDYTPSDTAQAISDEIQYLSYGTFFDAW